MKIDVHSGADLCGHQQNYFSTTISSPNAPNLGVLVQLWYVDPPHSFLVPFWRLGKSNPLKHASFPQPGWGDVIKTHGWWNSSPASIQTRTSDVIIRIRVWLTAEDLELQAGQCLVARGTANTHNQAV